jgi:hypothetical protein
VALLVAGGTVRLASGVEVRSGRHAAVRGIAQLSVRKRSPGQQARRQAGGMRTLAGLAV